MAEQSNESQGRGWQSTANLNSLSADSMQLDYLSKEIKAAEDLLKLQTGNAETLSELRLKLLDKLMQETKQRGEEVETGLAEFKYQKSLETIDKEIKEIKDRFNQLQVDQVQLQQSALRTIKQAEEHLIDFRLSSLKTEATQKLKYLAEYEKAELAAIKRKLKVTADNQSATGSEGDNKSASSVDFSVLEAMESEVDQTISLLSQELQTLSAERIKQVTELANLELGLNKDLLQAETAQQTASLAAINNSAKVNTQSKASIADDFETLEAEAPEAPTNSSPKSSGKAEAVKPNMSEAEKAFARSQQAIADLEVQLGKTLSDAEKESAAQFARRLENLSTFEVYQIKSSKKMDKLQVAEQALVNQRIAKDRAESAAEASLAYYREQQEREAEAQEKKKKDAQEYFKLQVGYLEEANKLSLLKGDKQSVINADDIAKIMEKGADGLATELTAAKEEKENALTAIFDAYNTSISEMEDKLREYAAENPLISDEDLEKYRSTLLQTAEETKTEALKAVHEKHDAEIEHLELLVKKEADSAKKARKAEEKEKQKQSKFGQSKVGKALAQASDFNELREKGKARDVDAQAAIQEQLDAMGAAIGSFITELNQKGAEASKKQAAVDTRLQGSNLNKKSITGSYWGRIDTKIASGVGVSPFLKQESVASSVEALVEKGISFNLTQRAFLNTIKDKIATTFDAADGTLLKLVRIQQADTTAARLGMESALTSFLNSMYETSEYMTAAADSIRANLYEASALMEAEQATEYEYQVQKWLGSLYSAGFNSAEKVSEALGKLTAGDIGGITEGGIGNLLVMAANEASIPIAEILEKGLTPEKTNSLMKAMVEYLSKIYAETGNSNVLAQQFANVYGVTASDLKAAANLTAKGFSDLAEGKDALLKYSDFNSQLNSMANSMVLRTSMAEMMENMKENLSYTFAMTIANNPILSGLNNMANMLNDLVGGIEIPFVNVYGFGFDLNASIADLMNVAALGGTVLGGMGKLIASLGSAGGFSGSGMLKQFGVDTNGATTLETRGSSALSLTNKGGSTLSESGMIGNESDSDIKDKTLADASEGPEKQIAEAKEDQDAKEDARVKLIDGHIVDIYDLLQEVVIGTKKFHVHLDVGNNPIAWSAGTWSP